ncbi:MAG: hypothetical protein ABH865_08425 [Candidatus Omnitrophota bacterium]|nr:hypothetical protein [Candidatus Omnitrophota bacterium]
MILRTQLLQLIITSAAIAMSAGCTQPAPSKPSSPEKKMVVESRLEGVIYSETDPIAIIGGNNYHSNDAIGNYTITKIEPDKVTLKTENGDAVYRVGDIVTKEIVTATIMPDGAATRKNLTGSQKRSQSRGGYGGQFDLAFKYYNDAQNYFNTAESHMYYAQERKISYTSKPLRSKVGSSWLIDRAQNEYRSALEYYQKAVAAAQSSRESERLSDPQNRQMLYIIDKAREKSILAENEQLECARIKEDHIPEYKGDGT